MKSQLMKKKQKRVLRPGDGLRLQAVMALVGVF
jgi:hypothetical protein